MQRRVRVYDNGGRTVDRYTVAILRTEKGKKVADIYGMSEDPNSPQGFNLFSHTTPHDIRYSPWMDLGDEVGKRVKVQDLPADVIKAIEHRL